MATHLDLEEQEQLDQLKHFWTRYGNLISWVLVAVMGGVAAWNGYQYWQRTQSAQASALYDEVERAARAQDPDKAQRVLEDLRDKYGRTVYASHGGLLAAQVLAEKGKPELAKAALLWVADRGSDDGLKAVARLRLVSLMVEAKAYDEALKELAGTYPAEFAPLVQDRKGDVFKLQGKADEAIEAYKKAYNAMESRSTYRRLIEVKLNSLGVDPQEDKSKAVSLTEEKK
jgi:predicted negative regulator of RcsB-dependent stress response